MDRSEKYQTIELLKTDDESVSHRGEYNAIGLDTTKSIECSHISSSMSSSPPPKEFDVYFESQYMPICDYDQESLHEPDEDQRCGGNLSSIASSLSIESACNDYTPVATVQPSKTCRLVRCPACEKPMRSYYCAKCIQKGSFVTITNNQVDELGELKAKHLDRRRQLEQTANHAINTETALIENLQLKLRTLKKRTENLRNYHTERRDNYETTKAALDATKKQLEIDKKANASLDGKIELIKRYITARKVSVKKRKESASNYSEDIRQHVVRKAYQLTTEIFPIEEINLLDQNNSFVNLETSPLLTFSDCSQNQLDQQTAYSIIEPWLPSNGDYSAYTLWVNDNKDHIPASVSDLSERNPAFRICAGLFYVTQLVQNLASTLDVILPAKLPLGTFNCELLDDSQFSYNVAKLNNNVFHLCISQGIDISLLNPQKTIKNLLLLINTNLNELGRRPMIDIDNEECAKKVEQKLHPLLSLVPDPLYDFSKFMDDDHSIDSDWEISDNIINPAEMQAAIEQSTQQASYISMPLRLFTSFWSATG